MVTFAGCKIDVAGTYTLTATSGALTAAVSGNVVITVGAAAKLGFTTEPSGAVAGVVLAGSFGYATTHLYATNAPLQPATIAAADSTSAASTGTASTSASTSTSSTATTTLTSSVRTTTQTAVTTTRHS